MSALRLAALALLLAALLPACMISQTAEEHAHGVRFKGLFEGYATAGWPADDSILKLGLFDGRSDGALFLFQVWKLVRVEAGLVGFSVGLGLGFLLYEPEPPAYCADACEPCDTCEDGRTCPECAP
jgi:hypothetical protein